MDRDTDLRQIAIADQANAAYRDGLKSFRALTADLALESPEEQQAMINDMDEAHKIVACMMAQETGMQWILDLIPEKTKQSITLKRVQDVLRSNMEELL